MLKVRKAGDRDGSVYGPLQCATNKGGNAGRYASDRVERSLFCYVFETGRKAISRRQLVIPCYGGGDCSIRVLSRRHIQRCATRCTASAVGATAFSVSRFTSSSRARSRSSRLLAISASLIFN